MRFGVSDHLSALVADAEAAAARLRAAPADARRSHAHSARRLSARLSARLDASPLTEATADEVDRRLNRGLPPVAAEPGGPSPAARLTTGWARTLKVDELATEQAAALEYANLLACFDAESAIAGEFLQHPRQGLAELHRILCRGLVDDAVAGQPRRSDQAVHDGAQGRVIYHPAPPGRIDVLLDELSAWLSGPGRAQPPLIAAGVVHERVLQWQPFEAANGRVARAAQRVVLRAGGLDPDGLAVAERLHAADPLAYHAEVAATIRRREDLGPWLERAGEAIVAALVVAAEAVHARPPAGPPAQASELAASMPPGAAVTVAEYADQAGVSRAGARADLRALAAAGWMQVVPGTRGLRYRRR